MKQPYEIDLGVVHIHKNVVADIVASTVADVDGVRLIPKSFAENCGELFGQKVVAGVTVNVDENSDVSVDIQVVVRYGMNIPDIGRHIQDVVRSIVQKTVDISLKEINVNIQGIERGQK
ncbi:MAG: Asp23/Gls24 family envelope stress response protein [Candidatus Omnitrophica bacterium]|nr:Asp23/Gls24 family envelope stress response protein [Candidatus Omnitrophota bacterium]